MLWTTPTPNPAHKPRSRSMGRSVVPLPPLADRLVRRSNKNTHSDCRMSTSPKDLELCRGVALWLCEFQTKTEVLIEADRLVLSGKGKALFDAIVANEKMRQEGRRSIAHQVMPILEQVIDSSPRVGAYLMARLYPPAGRTCHEVYNGIGLWMNSLATTEEAEVIAMLASETNGLALKKRYLEWSSHILENAALRRK